MNLKSWLALLRNVSIRSIKKGEILVPEDATKKDVYYRKLGTL